jgi:hypothetical protein
MSPAAIYNGLSCLESSFQHSVGVRLDTTVNTSLNTKTRCLSVLVEFLLQRMDLKSDFASVILIIYIPKLQTPLNACGNAYG